MRRDSSELLLKAQELKLCTAEQLTQLFVRMPAELGLQPELLAKQNERQREINTLYEQFAKLERSNA